ncbi:glycosyltransferase [Actinomadura craniellae]|uniref:glycosyltransferase n=1 Tax=Actinomadura craniellae TaxID=2231787 RepID=UPI001F21FAE3|nr:glycosyltransferase [Actinomadura craniellae]
MNAEERPLVLVSVGTDFHHFARLVQWADRWAADVGPDRVRCLIQHGATPPPEHAEGRDYLDHDELGRAMAEAVAIVSHGGPATITEARRTGHLPIVVARDPGLGEHVDGHQQRFVRRLAAEGLIAACDTEEELRKHLDAALAAPEEYRLPAVDGDAPAPAAVRRAGVLIDALVARRRPAPADPEPAASTEPAHWPSVTVVIPTISRAELLRATIESILEQDYPGDVHCLVVHDNVEPDESLVRTAPGRRVSVLSNTRTQGAAGARNSGAFAADGDLIAFCDDDDLWLPGKLRAQVRVLHEHPDTELVCCGIQIAYDDHTVDRAAAPRIVLNDLLRSRLAELHTSTYLIRREAVSAELGVFDEEVPGSFGEDYEFLLRMAQRNVIRNVPGVHVRVLWHRQSYFMRKWETMAHALTWLLERYPEFRLEPRGLARIAGQIAFAEAARRRRRAALRWAARTVRARPAEARAYLALAVLAGVPADAVLGRLHRRGRSI